MGRVIVWLARHQLRGKKPWERGKWDKQNSMGCRMGEESLTEQHKLHSNFLWFLQGESHSLKLGTGYSTVPKHQWASDDRFALLKVLYYD